MYKYSCTCNMYNVHVLKYAPYYYYLRNSFLKKPLLSIVQGLHVLIIIFLKKQKL